MLLEADDLGEQRQALVGIAQLAEFADAHAGHHGLEQGSGDLGDPPADLDRPAAFDGVAHPDDERRERRGHGGSVRLESARTIEKASRDEFQCQPGVLEIGCRRG